MRSSALLPYVRVAIDLACIRAIVADARGVPHAEAWAIDGLGHAWSGRSPVSAEGPRCGRAGDERGLTGERWAGVVALACSPWESPDAERRQ